MTKYLKHSEALTLLKEVISELQCWRTCNFHNTGGHGAVRIVAQDSQPRITGIGVEGGLEGKPRGKVWMQQVRL